MRDVELYRQILGLAEPWFVSGVDLKLEQGQVDVRVEHRPDARWTCPRCGRECPGWDHAEPRTWRHLDTCQFQTLLHVRVPRVQCAEHGVLQVQVPWAEARSRFTLLMERWVIDVLTQCATVTGACRLLQLSWDEVFGIMRRAVARGLARKGERPLRAIGVDKKAFRKGHRYLTVVCDADRATVEYVAEDRTKASLAGFCDGLSQAQRAGIEAVAMDMWDGYVNATRAALPDAGRKIVFDRFHVMSAMGQAVNTVRKAEHRALQACGDTRLVRTKYLWLTSEENLTPERDAQLRTLLRSDLKVARAWAIKEALRHLWSYRSEFWAGRYFRKWFHWATHSRLPPVRKLAHQL